MARSSSGQDARTGFYTLRFNADTRAVRESAAARYAGAKMMKSARILIAVICAMVAAPAPAAPTIAKHRLKAGAARCQVNDGPVQPCIVRRNKPGSFDVETKGATPLLAYVETDAVYVFELYGPERTQIPLYGTYAIDPKDPACWRADDSDVAVRELCVR
jgi:hypothetical protein